MVLVLGLVLPEHEGSVRKGAKQKQQIGVLYEQLL